MQTADNSVWSPQLVEELMFRQYIKSEDVSRMVPPAPKVSNGNFLDTYSQSTKILFDYVRNGPVAALASQNVNTAAGKHYGMTPVKPFAGRPANVRPPVESATAARALARAPTPSGSRAASATKLGSTSSPPPASRKRAKVEWPAQVPTNDALKSNSRSKVAPVTAKRALAQQAVDPDLIFAQNEGELPLNAIFAQYPKALKAVSAVRNASGDWRTDTFSAEEEQLYKKELGFTYLGPSQCTYGQSTM